MAQLESNLNQRADDFKRNEEAMRALAADLRAKEQQAAQGGGDEARDKHTARGKMQPREREQLQLEPGAPFLELSPLAAKNKNKENTHSASIISGFGRGSGLVCVIGGIDATVN